MTEKIYFVSGGKGGTGKSMASIALIDYFLDQKFLFNG
jgi:MinD superfamily P-loop ATPase